VRRSLAAATATCLLALALAASAGASDGTLRTTLDSWSRKIGTDARAVALEAQRRHPKRMATYALRFRGDALKAHAAIASQHPGTARGRQAWQLALSAFTDYAAAGSKWAASGKARSKGQKAAARKLARAAAVKALAGNKLLVTAGKLLR
jgi:hypothetical protein